MPGLILPSENHVLKGGGADRSKNPQKKPPVKRPGGAVKTKVTGGERKRTISVQEWRPPILARKAEDLQVKGTKGKKNLHQQGSKRDSGSGSRRNPSTSKTKNYPIHNQARARVHRKDNARASGRTRRIREEERGKKWFLVKQRGVKTIETATKYHGLIKPGGQVLWNKSGEKTRVGENTAV